MAHAVTLPGERLAGMTADLMLKLKSGSHTLDELDLFLQRRPPFVTVVSGDTLHLSEGVSSLTAGASTVWTVDDEGNIHFTLTSNGFTCEQWEQHLERRGWRIVDYARQVLRRASESPTNGVTYNIVVCPGKKISNSDRITKKIRAAADKKGWVKLHWEVSCLIRDTFTDEQLEQMDLWYIVTMHEPIKDSDGVPNLLDSRRDDGGRWLNACFGRPGDNWHEGGGFAFAVPQVGPQT